MRFEVDALLFDMDGTLVDSTASVLRGWRTVSAEFPVPPALFDAVPRHGRPAVEILADLLPRELIPAAAARLDELERTDTGDVVALPGAAGLLAAAPPGRWAVVTSAGRALAGARLAAAGIDAPLLVTIDDVSRGKPDPEPFLLGAKLLGVPPQRCLVFEDAPAGLAAARAAGAATVAVATTHPAGALDADLVLADLAAVRIAAAAPHGAGPIVVTAH
ncbi:HAD-IA family hydrolase [Actinocrinis puniceicyclus]|uniref:HAD-IA family hydrolase n=1 Tax=Actinocrinis puniceicyclus TaxID=977794 RepID=A0A8J7WQ26_9ACTN|nr:HAD-IA family hydrolase [Actinocrinis puniceicyclus]MBS2965418.1 HAD-IA family hydrolase [Actinocrinis puniceicyclus]